MAAPGPLLGEFETGYLTLEALDTAEFKLSLEVHVHRLRLQHISRKSGEQLVGQRGSSSVLIVVERVSEEVLVRGLKAYRGHRRPWNGAGMG